MHYFIGHLGHLFVIISFVAAIATAFSYFKATNTSDLSLKSQWLINGRVGFTFTQPRYWYLRYALRDYIQSLFRISLRILTLDKNFHLLSISTFWNGQEGSFLLWDVLACHHWHCADLCKQVLGSTGDDRVRTRAGIPGFSMILGVVIPESNLKIGSSPFILLRDALFWSNLLNSTWLYSGRRHRLKSAVAELLDGDSSANLVFGFGFNARSVLLCIAGLWIKKWQRMDSPCFTVVVGSRSNFGALHFNGRLLGIWNIEFWGYWNWDPLKMAVYVPWLVLIASIHTMIGISQTAVWH